MASAELVRSVPLIAGLTPAEIDGILSISHRLAFAPGTHLMRQGRPADGVFIVETGTAEVMTVRGALDRPRRRRAQHDISQARIRGRRPRTEGEIDDLERMLAVQDCSVPPGWAGLPFPSPTFSSR